MKKVPQGRIGQLQNVYRNKVGYWPEIDNELFKWVEKRNKEGLWVKDKFIAMQAIIIRNGILAALDDSDLKK